MLTEAKHAGCYLVQEGNGFYSRDALTVALSQNLVAGQVCGRRGVPSLIVSSVAADAGNTGNGVFTIDGTNPVSAAVQNGAYRVVCIEPITNGGVFEVEDPQGVPIGRANVGATFNNQIKFSIADGATDFAAGDAFTVTVIEEDSADTEVAALDFAATDGLQNANCINFAPVVTDGTTKQKATFTTRHAEVRASDLTWPAGATANQIAAAVEQLRAKGIILR